MNKRIKILAFLTICFIAFFSCKKDDARSCMTCTSPDTEPFELCEESDGSASVNGQQTGVSYDIYLNGLEESGASCGM